MFSVPRIPLSASTWRGSQILHKPCDSSINIAETLEARWSMSVVVRRYLGRSRLAEELVEDLIVEHRDAMFARDVDELIAECLELEKLSKVTWTYVLEVLFSEEQAGDIDEIGHMMKTASTKILEVFDRVKPLMETVKGLGLAVNDSADFLIAHQVIRKIKDDVENKFPPINEMMVKQSMEAFRRGAYQPAEDLLRESQNQGS
jgi:hypothetical protein